MSAGVPAEAGTPVRVDVQVRLPPRVQVKDPNRRPDGTNGNPEAPSGTLRVQLRHRGSKMAFLRFPPN